MTGVQTCALPIYNVASLRSKGYYTICFGNSTNTMIAEPRVQSWQQAYELIHKHFGR